MAPSGSNSLSCLELAQGKSKREHEWGLEEVAGEMLHWLPSPGREPMQAGQLGSLSQSLVGGGLQKL